MKFRPLILLAGLTLAALVLSPVLRAQSETQVEEAVQVFKVDGGHSSVLFRVIHMGVAPFWGTFNEVDGEVHLDAETPTNSKIMVTVKADSVDTRNSGRDRHVKSADFLDAENHPDLKFESTTIVSSDGKIWNVKGVLTARGKSLPVDVKVMVTGNITDRGGNHRVGAEAEFTFNRQDFGIAGGGVSDEVKVIVALEAIGV